MGVVVVEESGAGNPAAEGTATEEEAKIEEIIRPEEEKGGTSMHLRHEKARRRVGVLRRRPLGPRCPQTAADSRRPNRPDKGKSIETPILPIKLMLKNFHY
jgi:hypothetical protein